MRGESDVPAQGGDPREWAEPDRAGHRVRLLLLPRGVRSARGRLRDRHGELQPRDGVDRLRHGGPAVLRAADLRGCVRGDRARALRRGRRGVHGAVWRADALEAGPRAAAGGRERRGHLARFHRPGRGSQTVRRVALGSGHPAGAQRDGDVARGGARGRGLDRVPGARAAVLRPRWPSDGDRL